MRTGRSPDSEGSVPQNPVVLEFSWLNISIGNTVENVLSHMSSTSQDKNNVMYFPEICCFVHYFCHKKIHNGERPDLIQFEDGDSRKFYDMQKNTDQI